MLMDILGGVLSGAEFAGRVANPHRNFEQAQNVGHLFICLRPDLFMPREEFLGRMDELIAAVKTQPRASGFDEILIPGEREQRRETERLAHGIPLTPEVVDALRQEAGGELLFDLATHPLT
jgi:LDH2 family malate/lactate/ureidoglycolate dehydrogenase